MEEKNSFKEPAGNPLVMILLIVLALMTSPWYARSGSFEKLVLAIPLWVWMVLLWTILLIATIMAVAKYFWKVES